MLSKNALRVPVLIAVVALVAVLPAAGQQRLQLLPAAGSDLVAGELVTLGERAAPAGPALPDVPREAVHFSWALDPGAELTAQQPVARPSREYWLQVRGEQLAAGVPLYTTAPGALVRLNPTPSADGPRLSHRAALELSTLELLTPAGESLPAAQAIDRLADSVQLRAAGAAFPEGTLAFRLRPELGAGEFTLRAAGADDGRYTVHLLDRESPVTLGLAPQRFAYLDGQRLVLEAQLAAAGTALAADEISAFVTSPAGRAWPVRFDRTADGSYRGELVLDAQEAPAPGLWEVELAASGRYDGQAVLRNARTAFAAAVPSARFTGEVSLGERRAAGEALSARLAVAAASAGRYEVRGVLFGTDAEGALRPLAVAHAATWLEPGEGSLALRFEGDLLAASGLSAPYELRQLELRDQAHLALLHQQARALVIDR